MIHSFSLVQLIKDNNKKTNKRSLNTEILEVKYKKRNKKLFTFLALGKEDYSDPKGHIVNILFLTPKGQTLKSDVLVHCSCPAFQYWGSAYNSSNESYGYKTNENRAPNIRDPKRENKICKHIASTRKILRNKTLNLLRKKSIKSFDDNCIGIHNDMFLKALERIYGNIDIRKVNASSVETLMINTLKERGI